MTNKFIIIIFIFCFCSNASAQDNRAEKKGKVTFVTAKNVYVKFDNTDMIKIGDSLRLAGSNKPCLLVKNKSSKSVVTIVIGNCDIKKEAVVVFKYILKKEVAKDNKKSKKVLTDVVNSKIKSTKKQDKSKKVETISGKISLASYSNFYTTKDSRHRIMTRFSMYADHINNSNISFETYMNYRREVLAASSKFNGNQTPFKVYNLAVKYEATPSLLLVVGRKINNKTSSLGAIDGLQVEKYFGKNYIGVIAGFRPDLTDYSFNSDLLQYGVYVGRKTSSSTIFTETTLGFIEQKNGGNVDRRYTYFQHSSNFFNRLNLFSSFELDIYSKLNGVVTNDFRMTNFYTSLRYKFSRKFNINVSYDSRKRIIYYETFRSQIEQILADDVSRQGLRFRINTKPFKYVRAGMSYSARFQSGNQNKSDNINAYISMYKLPNIGGSISVNYNRNSSNYLEGNIISIRHSRTLFDNKLSADFYFRYVNYNYTSNESKTQQKYFGTNLSLYISRNLRFSIFGEYVVSDFENNYRINTKIVKRFNNKKKKKKYVY